MDLLSFMLGKAAGGGGGGSSVTVESLTVATNDTYTAPAGKAYSPVVVNVPNSYSAGDEGKVVSNGALVAQTAHAKVTQNGTIDTTLNNSVEVDVSGGGASNVVIGSFTPSVSNGVETISLDYTGSGFPIAALIWCDISPYNPDDADWADLKGYPPLIYSVVKRSFSVAPQYAGSSVDADYGSIIYQRKSSSDVSQGGLSNYVIYSQNDPSFASSVSVQFPSATQMKVATKSATGTMSYGFPVGVKYNYCVVYSS